MEVIGVRSVRKFVWRGFLLLAVAGMCGVCFCIPFVSYNDQPPWEALEVARRHAREAGHDVVESGGAGEYVAQPDRLGGCEVEVQLGLRPAGDRRTVAVRLRRSSALGGWRLVSVDVREAPP